MQAQRYIYLPEHRTTPYCDCYFPRCTAISPYKGSIPEMVECRCGEEDCNTKEWQWEESESDANINGSDITFHPIYSQGTTIIRGDKPLKTGMVHFWEIRVITVLAGTDVMFGIGTDKLDLGKYKHHFVSALGINDESWGYSYNGMKQHNGRQETYGHKYSQGCIVGVYLDLSRGLLEFFLNRRSLGVAYKGIPVDANVKIYPMVCSTAAKSSIRLINSSSREDCLQLRSFQAVAKEPNALRELQKMPGLRTIWENYWFFVPNAKFSNRSTNNEIDIADEAVLSPSRLPRKPQFRDEDPELRDLYANLHKIAVHNFTDSDDEYSLDDMLYYLF